MDLGRFLGATGRHGEAAGKKRGRVAGPCAPRITALLVGALLGALLMLAGCGDQVTTEEHFAQGSELAKQGDFEGAAAEFQAVLDKDPGNVSAMTMLGVTYYHLQRLDEAIARYQQAIELAPGDADIHSNLAAAYVQRQELDRALEEYQAAIRLNPKLAEAHFGLGVIHLEAGNKEEAIHAFESFQQYDQGQDPLATGYAEQYLEQLRNP